VQFLASNNLLLEFTTFFSSHIIRNQVDTPACNNFQFIMSGKGIISVGYMYCFERVRNL